MIHENLKQLRKSRGLTQEEFALKLNVVRQTVSKWEKGLSVPDAEMLMEISEKFEIPVTDILGGRLEGREEADDIRAISEKLSLLNEQLARNMDRKHKLLRGLSITGVIAVVGYMGVQILTAVYASLIRMGDNAALATIGGVDGPTTVRYLVGFNAARIVLVLIILSVFITGIYLTRKK